MFSRGWTLLASLGATILFGSSSIFAQDVEVLINNTGPVDDDYIGWTPVGCSIKLKAPASADLEVLARTGRHMRDWPGIPVAVAQPGPFPGTGGHCA